MRKKLFAYGSGIIVIGLAAVGAFYLYQRNQSRNELERILAELDANDHGWQLDDLDKVRLDVPAEENAGPIILKLRGQIPTKWFVDDPESHWEELWPNEPLLPADAAKFH